jgi:hypothetical protein
MIKKIIVKVTDASVFKNEFFLSLIKNDNAILAKDKSIIYLGEYKDIRVDRIGNQLMFTINFEKSRLNVEKVVEQICFESSLLLDSTITFLEVGFDIIVEKPVYKYLPLLNFASSEDADYINRNDKLEILKGAKRLRFFTCQESNAIDEKMSNVLSYSIGLIYPRLKANNTLKLKDLKRKQTFKGLIQIWNEEFKLIKKNAENICKYPISQTVEFIVC